MKRYPLQPLLDLMEESANQACLKLGLSGSTQQQYRRDGVTERVADRLAVRAGFFAYEVWPEMADDLIASVERECARDGCSIRFVPVRKDQLACCKRHRDWVRRRRFLATPKGTASNRRTSARYYAENGDYVRSQMRRRRQQEAS